MLCSSGVMAASLQTKDRSLHMVLNNQYSMALRDPPSQRTCVKQCNTEQSVYECMDFNVTMR